MTVRFRDFTDQFKSKTRAEVEKIITRKALEIERNAKRSMKGGGKPHHPSKPGEPPRVDTGRLRNSITHEVVSTNRQVKARIGTNLTYARELELGTSRILPRPFLRPALIKVIER